MKSIKDHPNLDGLTYDQWMRKVDAVVRDWAGVSVHDLADFPSFDMWADSVPPEEAAELVLEEEGFPF